MCLQRVVKNCASVKSTGEEPSGAPVKSTSEEPSDAPVIIEGECAPITGDPEDAPMKPVKGASRSEPKGAPGNVGRKSGGKGANRNQVLRKETMKEGRKELE